MGNVFSTMHRWVLSTSISINEYFGLHNPGMRVTEAIEVASLPRRDPLNPGVMRIPSQVEQAAELSRKFPFQQAVECAVTTVGSCTSLLGGWLSKNKISEVLSGIHRYNLRKVAGGLYYFDKRKRMNEISRIFRSNTLDQVFRSSRITRGKQWKHPKHATVRWQREIARAMLLHAASA